VNNIDASVPNIQFSFYQLLSTQCSVVLYYAVLCCSVVGRSLFIDCVNIIFAGLGGGLGQHPYP
jgi:hypothetical protein